MTFRLHRYPDAPALASGVANLLIRELVQIQSDSRQVHLALTGGRIAHRLYDEFARLALHSDLDFTRLHLWWSDERFLPMTDPQRNSQQVLGSLARTLPLIPSQIHPIPASDGAKDPSDAAFAYAADLAGVQIDICLLSLGEDGHVGSLFPNHPSFDPTQTRSVIGVTDSPKPPSDRVSMTMHQMNQADQVWLLASGASKALATRRAMHRDEEIPAAHLHGRSASHLFADEEAANELSFYFDWCPY